MRDQGDMDRRPRIEAYLKRLYGYAYGFTGTADDAKDLVQECALKSLSASRIPHDEKAYRAWLFRILKNTFIDGFRQRTRETRYREAEILDQPVEYFCTDERIIDALTVKIALAKLPDHHRRIIALIDVAGLSYAETGEVLNIPVGTVMSRISRARLSLIKTISDDNVRPLNVQRRKAGR